MSSKTTLRKDGLRQMTYYITLPDGTRKRQFVYGHSSSEVREKRSKAIKEALNGNPVLKSSMTLEKFITEWIKGARRIRESTRSNYWGEIRKHIIPKIGKVRLSDLNTDKIQNMLDALIKEGVSVRTTQILKNILSKALRDAEMKNLVRPNIMKYVELETYHPKERIIWREEDAKLFTEIIKTNKYHLPFLLCITYGLRRGEALAIRWDDVDFDKGVIHIRRQYTIVDGKPQICGLKTAHSFRVLPLLPHIKQLIKTTKNVGEYLLTENGNPINPRSLDYEFKRILKKHNLPRVTLHSLRHFAATSLKNAGVTIKEAQEILGHSTPLTTMQYYQHSSIEDKKIALTKYAENMSF